MHQKKSEFTTREGCQVSVETSGANGFALTIKQKDGKSFTFACGYDEAKTVSELVKDLRND